ncbi:protein broad-minded-like isoform X2 [Corticium candelabrum]|uniref:protein broad-minded-like isoform X2 n=1 Tax=Corticium candelabrum TaxID=121492 RepID=UPI002E25BFC1|nr:protein broad-minded-like isoform X2 [Corticium candelabrum]
MAALDGKGLPAGVGPYRVQDVDHNRLVLGLRQLLASFESAVRASANAGHLPIVEDMLANLEATDEHFHSYEIVRTVRSKIDEQLGPLIETELERQVFEGDGHDVVPLITEQLLTSPEYAELGENIVDAVKSAANVLIQEYAGVSSSTSGVTVGSNFRESSLAALKDNRSRQTEQPSYLYTCDDDSSDSSTLNQTGTGFMFLSSNSFRSISANLSSSQPSKVRLDALHTLGHYAPGDLLNCQFWPDLKKTLQETLSDRDQSLSGQSLRLHSKLFNASNGFSAKEIFTNLVAHLSSFFTGPSGLHLRTGGSLCTSDTSMDHVLTGIQLLNDLMHEMPGYWVRYATRFTKEIVSSTVTFLSLALDDRHRVSSFLLVALIDPKALWFKKWMHPNYGRADIVECLRKDKNQLVVFAVTVCMDFFLHSRLLNVGREEEMDRLKTPEVDDPSAEYVYTSYEINYACFVSSISLVGRLLIYASGRELFPVQLHDCQVTITDFLVASLKTMFRYDSRRSSMGVGGSYDPAVLVQHMLKRIAYGRGKCKEHFLTDEFIDALLSPLKQRLSAADSEQAQDVCDETLVWIGDIMAVLASSQAGRKLLLYGEKNPRWTKTRFSAVHTLAQFAQRALEGSLSSSLPSEQAVSSFVFVCRQLYNTCEGLVVLYPYELHMHVAVAWREAVSAVATPLPPPSPGSRSSSADNFKWEDTLVDNLLNFAGTPKGLLLLQQTGTLSRCVDYMYQRYTNKLQVSKCEKFGYGFMVTMVASTAPGMVALYETGFLCLLVHDLWMVTEGSDFDDRLASARHDPMDPIHRAGHKALVNLLNVLSSFSALYEVIHQPPVSFNALSNPRSLAREVMGSSITDSSSWPSTIFDLIDRLVLVDSEPKFQSLWEFEQSHLFGLRFLSVLTTCLDSFLLLESCYDITDALLSLQELDTTKEGRIIIDMCSVERNRILIASYLTGGPSERIVPSRDLEDGDNPYPWPMFSSIPVPSEYRPKPHLIQHQPRQQQPDAILKYLEATKGTERGPDWIQECREIFYNSLKSQSLSENTFAAVLEQVVEAQVHIPGEVVLPLNSQSDDIISEPISAIQRLGVDIVIRYGEYLKVLEGPTDHKAGLQQLLQQTCRFLKKQRQVVESSCCTMKGEYVGHDWFVSSLFLLFSGKCDRVWHILMNLSQLLVSCYLWIPRLHSSIHLPANLASSGIHPLFSSTAHNVELLLQAEVPLVYSAFRLSGFTPAQMSQHWLCQCFWNYLDWPEICTFLSVCIVMGIDYEVYFCVAVFRHLECAILEATQRHNLLLFLKETPLTNFKCAEHLEYMKSLEQKYRTIVLTDLKDISKP